MKLQNVKIKGSSYARAEIDASSFNETKRTIDVVFATGYPVKRYDWQNDTYFNEVLEITTEAMDITRLQNGAPVLNTHDSYDLSSVLGVVLSASIDNGQARATIQLSNRPDIAGIIQDIQDGVIRNISVGYKVLEYSVDPFDPNSGQIPTYRATQWMPMEISFVPVPADPNAGVRSDAPEMIINLKNKNLKDMPISNVRSEGAEAKATDTTAEAQRTAVNETPNQPTPQVDENAIRQQAVKDEKVRTAAILECVRKAGLGSEDALSFIQEGHSIEKVRELVIDKLADNTKPTTQRNQLVLVGDESTQMRKDLETALAFRVDPSVKLESERAKDFRYASLVDIAKGILDFRGEKVKGLSPTEIAERAMSTSDFPAILANVANKFLIKAYTSAPSTWKPLSNEMNARDFKEITGTQLDGDFRLEEVQENGEYKAAKLKDGKETFSLKSYGKIISITRQSIINDDLNAFSRLSTLFGQGASDTESDLIWNLIIKNPKMSDGNAVFSAAHSNLLTGSTSALSMAGLSSARVALMRQTGLDGKKVLNLLPKYLIVPIELLTTAEQLMKAINSTEIGNVNPFAGAFQVISDARLTSASEWYLTTDPNQVDMLKHGYLNGQGLRMETRNKFNTDAVEMKAALDFGAAIWDYRGMVKSAGK